MSWNKLRRDSEKVIHLFINKELEPFGVTVDDIKDDEKWFMKYEVTIQDNQDWVDWCIKYLRDNYKITKKTAKKEMMWFNLQYGLKIK